MKIIIVGPVKPFRGGIAHSTNTLYHNLSKKHSVKVISFKRLYPKFLYPGGEQKEPEKIAETGIKTNFLIDSINPISWFQAFGEMNKEKPGRVIFIWWHTFFFPVYFTIAFLLRKFSECKIGCLCHNVAPHEENIFDSLLVKIFLSQTHYIVTYAKSNLKLIKKMLPKANAEYVSETLYEEDFRFAEIKKQQARNKIGIKKDSILFFGLVRKYKGLGYILEAMPKILKKRDVVLIVAGEFWGHRQQYLEKIEKLGISSNVKIVDRYIGTKEVPLYFKGADAVVLPYVSSTSSGIIQLAFGFNTPVITTEVGGNVDYIKNKVNGLLVPPRNSQKLAEAIIYFYEKKLERKFKERILEDRRLFEWNEEKERVFLNQI